VVCKGLFQVAASHEGVHQTRLLSAALPQQGEAHERHEVLVAVAAQDSHLLQNFQQALERRLTPWELALLTNSKYNSTQIKITDRQLSQMISQ
jgi:hypothetical protein